MDGFIGVRLGGGCGVCDGGDCGVGCDGGGGGGGGGIGRTCDSGRGAPKGGARRPRLGCGEHNDRSINSRISTNSSMSLGEAAVAVVVTVR